MVTYTTNTSNVTEILNQMLAVANNTVVLSGCPSGPLTSLSTSCIDSLKWSGTQGNKSSAGYYVEYDAQITQVKNAFEFEIDSLVQIANQVGTETISYKTSFTAKYTSDIKASFTASGSETIYIPSSQTCATACLTCCSTTCNKCSLSCGCGLTTKCPSCDCTTTCTNWPSTYDASPHIGFSTSGTATLKSCTMKGEVTVSTSINKPSSSGAVYQDPIYINNQYLPPVFYIFNSQLSNMEVDYSTITVNVDIIDGLTSIPITVSQSVAEALVTALFGDLQDELNGLIKSNVFPIVNKYYS